MLRLLRLLHGLENEILAGGSDVVTVERSPGEYFVFQKKAAIAVPKAGTQQLNVVLNWSEELKRRAPA